VAERPCAIFAMTVVRGQFVVGLPTNHGRMRRVPPREPFDDAFAELAQRRAVVAAVQPNPREYRISFVVDGEYVRVAMSEPDRRGCSRCAQYNVYVMPREQVNALVEPLEIKTPLGGLESRPRKFCQANDTDSGIAHLPGIVFPQRNVPVL